MKVEQAQKKTQNDRQILKSADANVIKLYTSMPNKLERLLPSSILASYKFVCNTKRLYHIVILYFIVEIVNDEEKSFMNLTPETML